MSWLRKINIVYYIVVTLKAKEIYRGIAPWGGIEQVASRCASAVYRLFGVEGHFSITPTPTPARLHYLGAFELERIRDNFFEPPYRSGPTAIY